VRLARHRRTLSLLLSLAALAAVASCRSTVAPTGARPSAARAADGSLPAAAFFADPLLSHVALSPDGQRIAAVYARDGVAVLIVRPTRGGEIQRLAKLDEPGMAIRTVGWANDDVILVGIDMPYRAVVGNRARQTRLMAVSLESRKPRYLGEDWPFQEYSQFQDQVIDWLPDDPDHVLINYWAPDQPGASAAKVNVANGALHIVVQGRPWVRSWYADHRGEVRAGEGGRRAGTTWIVYGRANAEERLEPLVDFDYYTQDGFTFAGFAPDPSQLYVYAPTASGRIGLYEYDLTRRALGALVYSDPAFDLGPLVTSRLTGRVLGVHVIGDRPTVHYFDEAAARERAAIERAFPGLATEIVSLDRAEKLAIVSVSGDTKPPEYYVFDRVRKKMDFLFAAYPEVDVKDLAPMTVVRYPARDGLEIQAYLTLRAEPGRSCPRS
jgi:dipeptidyl aminopeptidase/acylaminoacyl peptidase